MAQDYYETLGVSRDADDAALKKAFRQQAMKYHPDRNPDDNHAEQRFKEINEAYDVLKDPQKRAAYDRFGHAAFQGGGGGAGGQPGFDFNSGNFSDIFEDLFGDFMGGARRGGRSSQGSRGADLRYNMDITLEEAFTGAQKSIQVTTSVTCDSCDGKGAAKGTSPTTCPSCHGSGRLRTQQGFFTVERTCASCQGSGQIIKDPCKKCVGSGRVRKEKTLSVVIPKGVEDGMRIRLSNEGEAGARGAPPGDLYIFLSVKSHPLFRRDGAHIHCRVPLRMTTAALGGQVDVPAIDGTTTRLNIPAGTQSGTQFRLRGKGMHVMNSETRGDMYVHAAVETPVSLNKKQKQLLQEFDESMGKKSSPESESFFTRVKELWQDLTD